MPFHKWFFVILFSLIQGGAPLVHAHFKPQGQGFHFHINLVSAFQIDQGKESESLPLPHLVEQAALQIESQLPQVFFRVLLLPLESSLCPASLFSLFSLFARAPPLS